MKATARTSSQTVMVVLANVVTGFIIVSQRCLVFVYYYIAGPLFPVTLALIGYFEGAWYVTVESFKVFVLVF